MRKLAISAWSHPKDPSIYGQLELCVDPMIAYLHRYNETASTIITPLHFSAKVLGYCLEKVPELNQVLIRNTLYQRKYVHLFFPVHLKSNGKVNLSGVSVQNVPEKSLAALASDLHNQTVLLKQHNHREINRIHGIYKWCPSIFLKGLTAIIDFFIYKLNINPSRLGVPQDLFGSMLVSSIGAFGLKEGYIPLYPFSRCPISVGVGAVFVRNDLDDDGRVEKKSYMNLNFTIDHRYLDGYQLAKAEKLLSKIFKNPNDYAFIFE